MPRAFCPMGNHFPDTLEVFLSGEEFMDSPTVLLDNHGRCTNAWSDGTVGVPPELRELAEEMDTAYCWIHDCEVDWIHEQDTP